MLRSATKTFIPGLPVASPAGIGLTQIFAGTMDDSQAALAPIASPSQPMPTFKQAFPDSQFSEAAEEMILDSQPAGKTQEPETQGVQLRFSQTQAYGFDTLLRETQNLSQVSEVVELTQDGGFRNYSPLLHRFVEPPASTVGTEKMNEGHDDEDPNQSPLVRRTGKLRRRADLVATAVASDNDAGEDVTNGIVADEFGFGTVPPAVPANAFNFMKKAVKDVTRKKASDLFDKKKSKAREMIEEQAEESEDEYAGLGGADGEDSSDEDDQLVKEMIDDETKNNEADERKLAAFYA